MDMFPVWNSIRTAIVATVITFFLGIYAAKATLRLNRLRSVADAVFTLPMVLPPTVVGFFLLVFFGNNSALGTFLAGINISMVFSFPGMVIAASVVSFPLMYRTSRGAFEQMNQDMISAGRTLGMSERAIFYKIILPNCWPGIVAATVLAFARALGEFGATIMIAGNIPGKTQTISLAIYHAMQLGNRTLAYQYVAIIFTMSFIAIIAMNIIQTKQEKWMQGRSTN